MKQIKLYFDFEFTSLSQDAQPISLGIVADVVLGAEWIAAGHCGIVSVPKVKTKSFYAEFTDFDINRCDDWVKENVVGRLRWRNKVKEHNPNFINEWEMVLNTEEITKDLKTWLSEFSDYQIQFVCDCGTWDWYWLVQLLATWEVKNLREYTCHGCGDPNFGAKTFPFKTGLPKLPDNISPVPEDLNDLIARTQNISVREAFDLNREVLAMKPINGQKHNALWDAKVIKEIYQKLK